ncbi:hypothetical protein CEP86_11835 [Pseudomonas protegens]|jgi:hypothetical protein|uniref:DUF3077 domain-containing protein n=1 Tax=Pseudomonas protegens TaxID=380021 RepID=A0ABY2V985_9PSED|nr:hypothetical protein [Pseudomonas protegens]ASE21145.1 hypothetical protein CEP86_11835 [Pseudomonas protegens]QEZ58620.1 hypothetical protein D4N38_18690 [Pseudomonas protegens]QIC29621.1 hypothetical protein FQ342_14725 [Pseudomonas protegens]TMM59967.1 hypothetical protein FEF10_31635 [Pseudomonas protegens]
MSIVQDEFLGLLMGGHKKFTSISQRKKEVLSVENWPGRCITKSFTRGLLSEYEMGMLLREVANGDTSTFGRCFDWVMGGPPQPSARAQIEFLLAQARMFT